VSSSDWPRGCESLTYGSRSMVSVDRATTGPRWAGSGLDLGRAGPDTCQAVAVSMWQPGSKTGSGPRGCGSRWTVECGAWATMGSQWTESTVLPSLGPCAPSARFNVAVAPLLSLFHGHAPERDTAGMADAVRRSRVSLPPSTRALGSFHRGKAIETLLPKPTESSQREPPRHGRALAMVGTL
jgi:hypothetical protein